MKGLLGFIKGKTVVAVVVSGFVSVAVYLGLGDKKKGSQPPSEQQVVAQATPTAAPTSIPVKKEKTGPKKAASGKSKKKNQQKSDPKKASTKATANKAAAQSKKAKKPKYKKYTGNKFAKIKEEMEYYIQFALDHQVNCKKYIKQEIRNPDYVNPKSRKFRSSKRIIDKIEALASTVDRSNSIEAYRSLERLIYHKHFYQQKMTVAGVRKYLAEIEVCRDPHLFNFLMSSVEAANDRKWPNKTKASLHNKISKYFLTDLDKFPSTTTLSYAIQYLKGLVLNNFLDEKYREEILTLSTEVMEHQMTVLSSGSKESIDSDNLMVLQDDFKQRKDFGKKVRSMFRRVTRHINSRR